MLESFKRRARLFNVVSNNENIYVEDNKELTNTIRKLIYTPLVVASLSLIGLFNLRHRGLLNFSGPTPVLSEIKATVGILSTSFFCGTLPGIYYLSQMNRQLEEIVERGSSRNWFTEDELRMIESEEYFNLKSSQIENPEINDYVKNT